MDIEGIILKKLGKNKKIKAADIVKASGFSRAYINRFFQKLKNEGRIILLGRANKAYYVPADKKTVARARSLILSVRKILQNKNLSEDLVLDQIKRETGIFFNLPQNISNIIDYAFSEMLNNAIEHSKSLKIEIRAQRSAAGVVFEVRDWGVGIFNNIKKKRKPSYHSII